MGTAEDRKAGFHGLEIPLRSVPGARATRVVHGHGQVIDQHKHDWACITVPLLGQAIEAWDGGEACMDGPCVLVHPPGTYHTDHVGDGGLETVSIQFDPRWLSSFGSGINLKQTVWRARSIDARQLIRLWSQADTTDADLARSTASFLQETVTDEPAKAPAWLKHVRRSLRDTPRVATAKLAAQLDLNPAWLARAYRAVVGEGIQETARRRRIEHAVPLLRRTDVPLAEVAVASGFCDQSHMTRDFRILIARTPLQVRLERTLL